MGDLTVIGAPFLMRGGKILQRKIKEMGDLTVIGDNLRQANKVKGAYCLSGDAR